MSYEVLPESMERISIFPSTSAFALRRNAISDAILYSMLTQNERMRYRELAESKKGDWLLGRGVGKGVINAHVNPRCSAVLQPHEIEIFGMSGGQPTFNVCCGEFGMCSMYSQYCFSLSHTNGIAVAQVADRHVTRGVGIDVEAIREFRDETCKNFLTKTEYHFCMNCEKATSKFMVTLHWCLKEAYLKAMGTGLRTHPRQIEIVDVDAGGKATLVMTDTPVRIAHWTMVDDLYIIASICL